MIFHRLSVLAALSAMGAFLACIEARSAGNPSQADEALAAYFKAEVGRIQQQAPEAVRDPAVWKSKQGEYRDQLFEMLGLSPTPEKTPLQAVVTGRIEGPSFTVEKLHFQSMPGLYVTANLYLPKTASGPAPAVLYLCGHGPSIHNGVSHGNKVTYQHHAGWFAEHGYACLILDTLQLGEIEGLHHGTYREGLWWWNSRGYTPAGVEAWNGIRALDYLETRSEVDASRIGVTGRSGGGAYSWTVAALDDRVKAAAPVAGITDLRNYVVDGAVEGHCDCMFFVNTYRWDYPLLAARVAPRPLLLANTDRDSIFPLDGVMRTHELVRQVYGHFGAATNLGLLITEGPHHDTQDLQLPVLRWFNRFLTASDPVIDTAARKQFEPAQLKVLAARPADQRNTSIQESFVPAAASPPAPESTGQWSEQRDAWLLALKHHVFAGWPDTATAPRLASGRTANSGNLRLRVVDFESQDHVTLRLYLVDTPSPAQPVKRVNFHVLDAPGWTAWIQHAAGLFPGELAGERALSGVVNAPAENATGGNSFDWAAALNGLKPGEVFACGAPRGMGLDAWSGDSRKQTHIRRRFMLIGQTLEGMRVWDIRRALQALRGLDGLDGAALQMRARSDMAVNALYASLFEPPLAGLELQSLPASHRDGPDYLNVMRFLDIPQALAMAMERAPVHAPELPARAADYSDSVARSLNWENRAGGY